MKPEDLPPAPVPEPHKGQAFLAVFAGVMILVVLALFAVQMARTP